MTAIALLWPVLLVCLYEVLECGFGLADSWHLLGFHSKGSKTGASSQCAGCQGSGMKISIRQLGPNMIQQMQHMCSDCKGSGLLPTWLLFSGSCICFSSLSFAFRAFESSLCTGLSIVVVFFCHRRGNQWKRQVWTVQGTESCARKEDTWSSCWKGYATWAKDHLPRRSRWGGNDFVQISAFLFLNCNMEILITSNFYRDMLG